MKYELTINQCNDKAPSSQLLISFPAEDSILILFVKIQTKTDLTVTFHDPAGIALTRMNTRC